MKHIVNLFFEFGLLNRIPRTGLQFLGTGKQSVSEHVARTIFIGYFLSLLNNEKVDIGKVLTMCLLHDIHEARIGDLNYVNKKYVAYKRKRVIRDIINNLRFKDELLKIVNELNEGKSKEAIIAAEADRLEHFISCKEQLDVGNRMAHDWIKVAQKRFKTKLGKKIAKKILQTRSDEWYFTEQDSSWWVDARKFDE